MQLFEKLYQLQWKYNQIANNFNMRTKYTE